ncbi:MAG: hypothetical protein IJY36_06915 [Coprobacter sp.]|nr:hypothetical protein [Coprobacter sp.]
MAENTNIIIESLRNHVEELMERHKTLSKRCEALNEELLAKNAEIARLQNEVNDLKMQYRNRQTAQAAVAKEGDVEAARRRFDKLVREIDKCISLLNN